MHLLVSVKQILSDFATNLILNENYSEELILYYENALYTNGG